MNKREVEKLARIYLDRTIDLLGESKYYKHTPYLAVEYSPGSTGIDNQWKGEFDREENEIIIYTKIIKTTGFHPLCVKWWRLPYRLFVILRY